MPQIDSSTTIIGPKLQYWAAVASTFGQLDWRQQAAIFSKPPAPEPTQGRMRLELSSLASRLPTPGQFARDDAASGREIQLARCETRRCSSIVTVRSIIVSTARAWSPRCLHACARSGDMSPAAGRGAGHATNAGRGCSLPGPRGGGMMTGDVPPSGRVAGPLPCSHVHLPFVFLGRAQISQCWQIQLRRA